MEPATADMKTCSMCAEEVKAAAVVCRFCGHRFDADTEQAVAPLPHHPSATSTAIEWPAVPEAVMKLLTPGEEPFVWARCRWVILTGTLVVTSDRLIFLADLGPADSHEFRVAQNRQVTVFEHGVQIVFQEAQVTAGYMDTHAAKEIGATMVPSVAEHYFGDDPVMMERLRARHAKVTERAAATAPPPPAAAAIVKGCKYLGGFSQLRSGGRFVSFSLRFQPDEIVVQSMGKPVFRVSQPKTGGVSIEGREQLQQRLTATRMVGLGVFSLAVPKKIKRATSYITIGLANGETGIFEVENTDPMKLRANLSPWLAEH